MITVSTQGAFWKNGQWIDRGLGHVTHLEHPDKARKGTMAAAILDAHDKNRGGDGDGLRIVFDALASHDITYVGIVQTARAGGMRSFPLPYVLTNCHNSLCAVGGTINEDDHLFGLCAAQKYGGEYVPAHLAVIHQYMREMHAGCGKMILGSDSHTRYGALGCMGVGEGGPELVKQLLGRTYDLARPEVVAIYLEGAPRPGVGPQDVALALARALFAAGTVKNRVMEFMGPGVAALSVDYRMGIDVMSTETTCLSSIWQTDDKTRDWLAAHGRPGDYAALAPADGAWYDAVAHVDLDKVEPMIALPFHPANALPIREFLHNAEDALAAVEAEAATMLEGGRRPDLRSKLLRDRDGKPAFMADQGVVAGCSGGTYENVRHMARILKGRSTGDGAFSLSVYPASQPQYLELTRKGLIATLMQAGAVVKTAFCGPCFGAGDVPANNAFSLRHTTRNFPSREGSKPANGQIAYVALMDARSIAATAINGGRLTPATELAQDLLEGGPENLADSPAESGLSYAFDPTVYRNRVYQGFGKAQSDRQLIFGPNIADWPAMIALPENLLLVVASAIYDEVTTTDELIPSGETSSYRSNPLKLAEFTLSRKDPRYVGRAKEIHALELGRRALIDEGNAPAADGVTPASAQAVQGFLARHKLAGQEARSGVGSVIFARKPGDGSAREQAASCQKVLGGWANIAAEYATKRYRSNLVNWGMLPFILDEAADRNIRPGDALLLTGLRQALIAGLAEVPATLFQNGQEQPLTLCLPDMTADERAVILAGCLINQYAEGK